MANTHFTYLINIDVDFREGEYFVLTSSQLPGLLLSGKDINALREDVPNVIKSLFSLNYKMDVDVRIACEESPMPIEEPFCQHTHNNWAATTIPAH